MSNQFPNKANQSGFPHQQSAYPQHQYQQGGIPGFNGNGGHHVQPGVPFHHPQPPQGFPQYIHSQPQYVVPSMPAFMPQHMSYPQNAMPQLMHRVQPANFLGQNVLHAINPQQPISRGQFSQVVSNQHAQYEETKPQKHILKLTDSLGNEVQLNENVKILSAKTVVVETPIVETPTAGAPIVGTPSVKPGASVKVEEPPEKPGQVKTEFKEKVSKKLDRKELNSEEPPAEDDQTEDDQKKTEVVAAFRLGVRNKMKEIESSANIVDESVQKIRQEGGEDSNVRAYHKLFLTGFYDVLISSSLCALCNVNSEERMQVLPLKSDELEKVESEVDHMKVKNPAMMSAKSYSREFLQLLRVLVSKISQESLDHLQPVKQVVNYKLQSTFTPQNFGRLTQPVIASAFQTNSQRQGNMYQGRSSDKGISGFNILRKGPMAGRASLDRSKMAPPLSDKHKEVPVQRSATAWKPKREQKLDPEEAKYLKTKLEIRGLLNKVIPTNYEDMMAEFCNFRVHSDEKMLTEVIELIFDKAVDEPQYCCMYADLCKDQVISERSLSNDQSDLFRKGIINKCQHNFSAKGSEEELKRLEGKLSESIEMADKELLEEEISLFKSKNKRRAKGIITLIAELYRHSMLQDLVINWCILELLRLHTSLKEEEYIEFAVYFLETVGPIYDIHRRAYLEKKRAYDQKKKRDAWNKQHQEKETKPKASDAKDWRVKGHEAEDLEEELSIEEPKDQIEVERVFVHLREQCKILSQRTGILIMNLLDSRRNNWKQQLQKQGLKTISEVRQEAEQEQAEKNKLRQEFDQKKSDQRKYGTYSGSRLQSRPSGPYFARDSGGSIRSQGQDAREEFRNTRFAKAAQNSQHAGKEAPIKDCNIRKAVEDGPQLGRKSNFQLKKS